MAGWSGGFKRHLPAMHTLQIITIQLLLLNGFFLFSIFALLIPLIVIFYIVYGNSLECPYM